MRRELRRGEQRHDHGGRRDDGHRGHDHRGHDDHRDGTDTTANADLGALTGKCAELAGLGTKLAAAMGGQDAGVADVSKVFDELADEVPDEIKADWQVLAENFGKIAEALKGVDLTNGGTPDAETLAKLQELSATLDSQEVQQATTHIEAWVTKNC